MRDLTRQRAILARQAFRDPLTQLGNRAMFMDHAADALADAVAVLDRGRVALEPGPRYGAIGSGYARLNFATSEAILDEALARMATALG